MGAFKNFSYSTVLTAPSPATSGTSLVLASGEGSLFPDPASVGSFPIVIWPTGVNPLSTNAEIALVTARTSDTLTITRAQESTAARTVVAGDQVMYAPTAAIFENFVNKTGDENIDGRKTILGDIWYFMQNFNIFGKTRTTDGAGYQLSITAGDGKGVDNAGGIAQLKAGSGDSGLTSADNAPGANVQLFGGDGFGTGNAGEAWLIGGEAAGTGLGGDVLVQGGHVQDNAIGARVLIKGGVNETGTSGDVEISTPDAIATNENAGNIILKPGAKNGSGNNGKVKVQQADSSSISANLLVDNLTTERDFQFPDQSGTIALISDIPSTSDYSLYAAIGGFN